MEYHSFDLAIDDPHNYYPLEFLNTLTPNGLPPHVLKLKIRCPVILLRNLDPANGLCNGTRPLVRGFQMNTIDAEIVLGSMLGSGFSSLGYPYAHPMMKCSRSNSRESNSLSDLVLQRQ
jgi:hypothetical protein